MHLSVKTGAKGKGAAHAQYIEREGKYANREDKIYSESGNMPSWAKDKPLKFWKAADKHERENGRTYTELEVSLPRELSQDDQVKLVKEFISNTLGNAQPYTFAIHSPNAADGEKNPHAHIMFSERNARGVEYDQERFFKRNGAQKDRFYNSKNFVYAAREDWSATTNNLLAFNGLDARIDHRSYKELGIDLESQNVKRQFASSSNVEQSFVYQLSSDIRSKQHDNGERIINNPQIALDALTMHNSTFSKRDLEKFIFTHSDGMEQYLDAYNRVLGSLQTQTLQNGDTFTSLDMLETERENLKLVHKFNDAPVAEPSFAEKMASVKINHQYTFNNEQKAAFRTLTNGAQIAMVNGAAGTGKSYVFKGVKELYSDAGHKVIGTATQGITAQAIEHDTGARSYTLASLLARYEFEQQNPDKAEIFNHKNMVILVDEAGMIGSKDMNQLLRIADEKNIKLRLVGDAYQLNAVAAGSVFKHIQDESKPENKAELVQIVRQKNEQDREASVAMSRHQIGEGLEIYNKADKVQAFATKDDARMHIVSEWANSDKSKIMLAYTNQDTKKMNEYARVIMREQGKLKGEDVQIDTNKGKLSLAEGEQIVFNKTDKDIGVLNGTRGKIEGIDKRDNGEIVLKVQTDKGKKLEIGSDKSKDISHGYATTIHKSQGMTVDNSYVLASKSMNANLAYVASTRHRENITIAYSKDEFKDFKDFKNSLSKVEDKTYSTDFNVNKEAEATRKEITKRETAADKAPTKLSDKDLAIKDLNNRIVDIEKNMDKPAREYSKGEVLSAVREAKGIKNEYKQNDGFSFGKGDYVNLKEDYNHSEGRLVKKETNVSKDADLLVKGVERDKDGKPMLQAEIQKDGKSQEVKIDLSKAKLKPSERFIKEYDQNPEIRAKALQKLNTAEIDTVKSKVKDIERKKVFEGVRSKATEIQQRKEIARIHSHQNTQRRGKGLSR